MRIIHNNIIPFKGFAAINLFGILFVRKGVTVSSRMKTHEYIHTKQMIELGFIFFYIWYLIEWLVRLCLPGNVYRNISFEREAYSNEQWLDYPYNRKHFSFLKYL